MHSLHSAMPLRPVFHPTLAAACALRYATESASLPLSPLLRARPNFQLVRKARLRLGMEIPVRLSDLRQAHTTHTHVSYPIGFNTRCKYARRGTALGF